MTGCPVLVRTVVLLLALLLGVPEVLHLPALRRARRLEEAVVRTRAPVVAEQVEERERADTGLDVHLVAAPVDHQLGEEALVEVRRAEPFGGILVREGCRASDVLRGRAGALRTIETLAPVSAGAGVHEPPSQLPLLAIGGADRDEGTDRAGRSHPAEPRRQVLRDVARDGMEHGVEALRGRHPIRLGAVFLCRRHAIAWGRRGQRPATDRADGEQLPRRVGRPGVARFGEPLAGKRHPERAVGGLQP